MNRNKNRIRPRVLVPSLVPHLVMGLTLGILCALTLVVMDMARLMTMLSSLEAPRLAVLTFVLGTSLLFGVGASLTGFLMIMMDEDED